MNPRLTLTAATLLLAVALTPHVAAFQAPVVLDTGINLHHHNGPLVCLDSCGTDDGSDDGSGEVPNAADFTLVCIANGICPTPSDACNGGLTHAQADRAGIDCGSGKKKCYKTWQTWDAQGEIRNGTGSVRFWAKCGTHDDGADNEVSFCVAGVDLPTCKGDEGGDNGELGCFYKILSGNLDAAGRCVDPANPLIVYDAVGAGQDFIAAEHVHFLD